MGTFASHGFVRRSARCGAALMLVLAVPLIAGGTAGASSSVVGGGSGFAAPEIDQWKADTAVQPYNLGINYVAQGSSFGRNAFTQGTLDFGASDIVYPPPEKPQLQSQRCAGKQLVDCFVYVPVSAGGLSFMYNLRDASGNQVTDLKLTRKAACAIFTGAITQWNDPELVRYNPRLASFNRPIRPVIRADGAGESYVFSQFCIAVEPAVWHAFIADRLAHDAANVADDFRAGQPVSNWPQNWGLANPVPFADGVANVVASPDIGTDTIGYDAAAYAVQRSVPVASVQNAAGVFTQPTETNVTVALGYAAPNPAGDAKGTFILNFSGPDPRAYFPSTYSYVLAQTTGFDPAKGATIASFLCYAVSKGQEDAPPLRYARLSAPIVAIAIDAITQIPGAPSKQNCPVAGATPPPPPIAVVGGGAGGTGLPSGSSVGASGGTASAANGVSSSGSNSSPAASASTTGTKGATSAGRVSAGSTAASIGQASGGDSAALATQNLDSKLAAAAGGGHPASKSVPVLVVIAFGAMAAWLIMWFLNRRVQRS
jgi:ABC-type phosphate transport system substrate-binding protein